VGKHAFVYLVENSKQQDISIEQVNKLLTYYTDITSKTGEQLGWSYDQRAFPYDIEEKQDENGHYLILRGNDPKYRYLLIGVSQNSHKDNGETTYIQITLPVSASQGDVGKGNELGKFLAKQLQAELHLFNQRVMYFYKRK